MLDVVKLKDMKKKGEKIAMITAYDCISASIAEEAGIDLLLVGDSLGNVVLGYENTLPVTVNDILQHTQAVRRGSTKSFVISDMPFLSFQVSEEKAIENCGLMLKEGGANAVKLEGGIEIAPLVKRLTTFGIPVMGHLGLTPQSINQIGGYRVQGKTEDEKRTLLKSASALEDAGAFAVVLELMVEETAKEITESLMIPTIGIGAGRYCDGQVLVWHDLLGINKGFRPKFLKTYEDLYDKILTALKRYSSDVKSGAFPEESNVFHSK